MAEQRQNHRILFSSDRQLGCYQALSERTIVNYKDLCLNTMHTLQIHDQVKEFHSRINLWDLVDQLRSTRTYIRPTLEFLSTMHVSGDLIHFNLFNKHYELTMENFNEALGLPTHGHRNLGSKMDRENFWEDITMKDNNSHPKDSRFIISAPIRYAQIILSHSIFATGENTNNVTERDIFFLRNMVGREDWPWQPNIGYFIREHLSIVASDDDANRAVVVEGIITLIAKFFDINLEEEQQPRGLARINITYLAKAKHLRISFDRSSGDLTYRLEIAGCFHTHLHTDYFMMDFMRDEKKDGEFNKEGESSIDLIEQNKDSMDEDRDNSRPTDRTRTKPYMGRRSRTPSRKARRTPSRTPPYVPDPIRPSRHRGESSNRQQSTTSVQPPEPATTHSR